MNALLILIAHIFVNLAKMTRSAGTKAVMAENLFLKQQLIVVNRSRKRAPNLTVIDRFVFGCCALFINIRRIPKLAVILQPSTLLRFPRAERTFKSID